MKNILLVCFISLVSCVATQKDMIILQSQLDDLNSNIFTLKKNQADLTLKIEELNRTIIAFSETSKDLSSEMNKLSQKIEDYNLTTEKKITQIGKSIPLQKEEDESLKEARLFYKISNAFSSGKPKLVKDLAKEYLTTYSKGENKEMVYFYLAEILYLEDEFKESSIFYAKIITETPSFPNIDYVKLKYALSLLNLKDSTKEKEALIYLKDLEKNSKDNIIKITAKNLIHEISRKTQKKSS